MTLAILVLAAALLAYANGSNDNFKPVATLYGSNTLSYKQALILGSAAQVAGSIASVLLAGALIKAFGGKGLVDDATVAQPAFLIAVALGGAGTVLLATRLGFPISTTHALVGGLAGAGIALAPDHLAWSALGTKYAIPLLMSPMLAVAAAGVIYPLLRAGRKRLGINEHTCLCVGNRIEPVTLTCDGTTARTTTGALVMIDDAAHCQQRYTGSVAGFSAHRIVDGLHLISGTTLGFARGLNDTPKILALLVAASWSGIDSRISLAIVAVVMCTGGILHSRRLARTLGRRITEMNRGQGLVANAVASALVIGASTFGLPVSTTHVSTGAIFGIGAWNGRTHWNVVGQILAAWVFTLPIAGLIAWSIAQIV